jgi:hypothetical protein
MIFCVFYDLETQLLNVIQRLPGFRGLFLNLHNKCDKPTVHMKILVKSWDSGHSKYAHIWLVDQIWYKYY